MRSPAPRPCRSCPYRRDVPAGLWDESEYAKLARYDGQTFEQLGTGVFMCHQQDGTICAGWAGCHDMYENLALRIASASDGGIEGDELQRTLDYVSPVPLFASGAEAAAHGRSGVAHPSPRAVQEMRKLARRRGTR
jgi:hypothetical protein